MQPLDRMPDTVAGAIVAVLADIDDTMTLHGRLPARAYQAIEDLQAAGIPVVPVTGRPAGWCDMIARFWPVAGVVGENGAFYFAYDDAARTMRQVFAIADAQRSHDRARLDQLRQRILKAVPGCAVASDQRYREADLAIDFCEDVPRLGADAVQRIVALFEEAGATAKVSSIHVNGWFGQYDKLTMSTRLVADLLGRNLAAERAQFAFVGDSPNDAPMFGFFPNSCGVANVRHFAGQMSAEPSYVTEAEGGFGFVEVAERILKARKARGVAPGPHYRRSL